MSSFSTLLRPCSSAGTLPGSLLAEYKSTRLLMSRLHVKQVISHLAGSRERPCIVLLYERDNHIDDVGFPRSDRRLVVWACSEAARSRLALKRSSLSFEHSLPTLTVARLR